MIVNRFKKNITTLPYISKVVQYF